MHALCVLFSLASSIHFFNHLKDKKTMSLLTIIMCVLLPPLAVFMRTGLSGKFIVNIILTLIGWIPGVIHALYVSRE